MKRALGDLNEDNKITEIDALILNAHLKGEIILDDDLLNVADINRDGVVDLKDYVLLRQHLFGTRTITEVLDL